MNHLSVKLLCFSPAAVTSSSHFTSGLCPGKTTAAKRTPSLCNKREPKLNTHLHHTVRFRIYEQLNSAKLKYVFVVSFHNKMHVSAF